MNMPMETTVNVIGAEGRFCWVTSSASAMKGLTQFIADLRVARSHEQEQARINKEMQNIREKFSDTSLSAYNRRKYVAKLVYIYVLGYPVDLGYKEALALIKAPEFQDKQLGYLAITLIYSTNPQVVDLAVPMIMADLASLDDINTCLALSFVCSMPGCVSRLVPEVYKLVISPTSGDYVRKKASLALHHFYRANSSVINESWVDRIIALLDSPSLGVALSASALIKTIASDNCFACPNALAASINRLNGVFLEHRVPQDYVYYSVPCPWLCVRLLEIIQLFPSGFNQTQPGQSEVLDIRMSQVLVSIVVKCMDDLYKLSTSHDSPQHLNATNAVFFEVVNALEHHGLLISSPDLTQKIINTLTMFLHNKLATVRFLTLNTLANMSQFEQVKGLKDEFIKLLKDRDISVRRKAVDVLFNITDKSNVEHIAAELLDFLPLSDSQLRKDVVTVLAAILESCSASPRWYLDTALSLLMIGGSSVSQQIWQRVVRFVVGLDEIQAHAASAVFEYLCKPQCSEQTIKVGAYILGEYGELIAHESGKTPEDQFLVLQDCISYAGSAAQNILTTYVKFANLYPHLRPQIEDAFVQYVTSNDCELHQRATEYLNMLQPENIHLLPLLWEKMPAFGDKPQSLMASVAKHKVTLTRQNTGIKASAPRKPPVKSTLAPIPQERPAPVRIASTTSLTKDTVLSSNWEHGFRHMLTHDRATIFQDAILQVGCQYEFNRCIGTIQLRVANISTRTISGLSINVHNPAGDSILTISTKNIPRTTLTPQEVTELIIVCEAKQPFAVAPLCKIAYVSSAFSEMVFRLPIVVERFMSPALLEPQDFHCRWEQIGPEGEFTKTFKNFSNTKVKTIVDNDAKAIERLGYGIVPAQGPTVFAASILHTTDGGNFGCLIRLDPDSDRRNMTVTVRSTKKLVSVVLTKNVSNVYTL